MKTCDNCIGERAIKKFVSDGSINLRIIERAVNRIGYDQVSRDTVRQSLIDTSVILQARRIHRPDYEDVKQVLRDCGIDANCTCA